MPIQQHMGDLIGSEPANRNCFGFRGLTCQDLDAGARHAKERRQELDKGVVCFPFNRGRGQSDFDLFPFKSDHLILARARHHAYDKAHASIRFSKHGPLPNPYSADKAQQSHRRQEQSEWQLFRQ